MKLEDSTSFVASCFNGEPASCSFACPFSLDIRGFMEKLVKGRWAPAYKLLRNTVQFPTVVAALCDQPCQNHCQRSLLGDEPLALRALEAACIKYAKNRKAELFVIPPKTQHIAVIGAGAAGLSCALSLAQKKYKVTVIDKNPGWGGHLRQHPDFSVFDEDFKLQFNGLDIEFRFNEEVADLSTLQSVDAIYVATGRGGNDFGLLGSLNSTLLTAADPRIFLGGELTGCTLMESIAQGSTASKNIESYVLSGSVQGTPTLDKNKCNRYLRHDGAEKKPLTPMSEGSAYTEEETKLEAARCFQCDCDYCEASCEMLKHYRKKPHKIGLEVFTDAIATSIVSPKTMTREAYSCNICAHCKSVCPESVNVGALLRFSRADRVRQSKNVPAFHDFWLREFDFNRTEGAFCAAPTDESRCSYAFFPGCKLGAHNPAHVNAAYGYLKEKYNAGLMLNCCGAPAYWAGEEALLQEHLETLKTSWDSLGRPTLIFACASCERMFRELLPEVPQTSLYTLLSQDTALTPALLYPEATVFDPCAAREDSAMQAGVRTLVHASGSALTELSDPNRCCGFGGHMALANPALFEEIVTHRAEAGDKPYIVYCANCHEVFTRKGKACAHVLDAVFNLEQNKTVPRLHQKKNNTLEVKRTMVEELTGQAFSPRAQAWDGVSLLLTDALSEELDRRLISLDDLKEAIWSAEQTGDKFISPASAQSQCSLVKPALTYWVQYIDRGDGTYEVLDAYSHRMHFSKEE